MSGAEATVSLREVTAANLADILDLRVRDDQEKFVVSNAVSIAHAHFNEAAWYRAIYADETPVGFLMLADDPEDGSYYLWRLMIGAQHQGRGYGRRAMELLIEHVKMLLGGSVLKSNHAPGEGSPAEFYRRLGFQHTGREDEHGELEIRLVL